MPKPRHAYRPSPRKPRLWWPALLLLVSLTAGSLLLAALPHAVPVEAAADLTPPIPQFSLTNQEGRLIDNQLFAGKYYVTDFFFASCPGICPRMQQQLSRVYTRFRDHPRLLLLSHTIDPAHDSVPVLRAYAHRLGVPTARQWHFATAPHDTVFALSRAYLAAAWRQGNGPGSLIHSGTLALVGPQGTVLGTYDGLNPREVDQLLERLDELLATPDLATR